MIEHIIVLTTSTFLKELGITKIIKSTSESQFLLHTPTSCSSSYVSLLFPQKLHI